MTSTACQPDTITLLYVEDEQEARDILLETLELHFPQLRLLSAKNGCDGLECFEAHCPEIVVTDICMPLMDGIEMSLNIRSMAPETIIIATTAHSEATYLLKAIEIGIHNFVLKPLDYEKLFRLIEMAMVEVKRTRQLQLQAAHIGKLSQALEQSPSTVVITDRNGQIEYVNPKFTELTGYSFEEALGCNIQMMKSGRTEFSVYDELWRTVSSGSVWRGEFCNQKKTGEIYWESASISPVFDFQGDITHYVAVKEDITARKQAEQEIRTLNEELTARARALESVNRDLEAFNYTVSHDLLSPVTAIYGFTQVLLDNCIGEGDASREYIEVIHDEIKKMDVLIKALLKFSRLSTLEILHQDIDLSALAGFVAVELKRRYPSRRVICTIAEGLHCTGDYDLLRIVMENLLGNAWKYTARREQAVVTFGRTFRGTEQVYFVSDNGVGFDGGKAGTLFKTFTRLHSDSDFEGFGIGLATVERIVQKHGGRVWAEGEIGQGACIYFTLSRSAVDCR